MHQRFFIMLCVLSSGISPLMAAKKHQHESAKSETHTMNLTPAYPQVVADCSPMQIYDVGMGMCMPLPMKDMPMKMLMLSGSMYGGYVAQDGPRGRSAVVSTNMVMADLGTTWRETHYLNVDLMLTAEKWTLPSFGYPLYLQEGEENELGARYVDAQHPHSSPIMGMTFSDTIRLEGEGYALKLFFAPRGETTDGPVAFMHRPTGMINSDAPLGHHIGQDVGHITSTVLGFSYKRVETRYEFSVFNGLEPAPTQIDLPLGVPNSAAARIVHEFSPHAMIMGSTAYIGHPEPGVSHFWRHCVSAYNQFELESGGKLYNTFILGVVNNYANNRVLYSLGEEFWYAKDPHNYWGRVEILQRTPAQLNIPAAPDQDRGRWVAMATAGYTYYFPPDEGVALGMGGAFSYFLLPSEFSADYGPNPWSARVFLHLKGMRMWDL